MTTDSLRAELQSSRSRLLDAVAGVSEEQFKKRPAPRDSESGTQWCIAEVLAHLLQQERLRAERIAFALEHDGSQINPSTDEEHFEAARAGRAAPVPQLIHGLLASRREVERLLDRAAALDGGLQRANLHPRDGKQTIAWILQQKIIAHEEEHIAQIEDLKAQLGAESRR